MNLTTSNECLTTYRETIPGCISSIDKHFPRLESRVETLKSKIDLQGRLMDEIILKLLWSTLLSMELFAEVRPSSILDQYEGWLRESERILREKGYFSDMVTALSGNLEALWNEWDQAKINWIVDPDQKAQVVLVEACLRGLPEILSGKQQATEILFPDSSMELLEGVYKGNVFADLFNEIAGSTLVNYIQQRITRESYCSIRILEIGAGTGGTTAGLLEKLRPFRDHILEYCYTDISKAFLLHADEHFTNDNPYLVTKIFNVENSIIGQDIQPNHYDIVIATNVLHATKNIRETLRNAKATLRKNGIIILNEMCANSLFAHLTFGLLEGWWRYEDAALRIPGSPGLLPETWEDVLEEEGFGSIIYPGKIIQKLGQQIIVAESDGIVRIKQEVGAGKHSVTGDELSIELEPSKDETAEEMYSESLREKSVVYLKKLIADTLKIPIREIDSSQSFEVYGVDSILVVHLTNTMRKHFDNISSSLFFEVQTIEALVDYLMETQKEELICRVGLNSEALNQPTAGQRYLKSDSLRPVVAVNRKDFISVSESKNKDAGLTGYHVQDVAIIGLSGRYPQSKDLDEFWNNLKAGKNCITEVPSDRWNWRDYFDENRGRQGKLYTKWGGFLDDVFKFDPLFFRIAPGIAEQMDPQERLFIEIAYTCVADAGYTPSTLCEQKEKRARTPVAHKVGVFVGVMNNPYSPRANYSSIANRVSYLLNFQGPSLAVDTACSSSLTAIHLALESIYGGTSECAIAGGVNLNLHPDHYLDLSAAAMLSSTNQCKSFGDNADGFVAGEGVGAILLKPLSKAIKDKDHIYGIIKGSMLNAGGRTNGYTVPNPNAQFQLVADALDRAGVDAGTVSYLEAHGTGTALGDPVEMSGLTRAFEQGVATNGSKPKQFCAIGSVKSNIGHCESAAGIAGLTKVLLQLKNSQLAPSLHSTQLNPDIDFKNTPFVVQQQLAEWKRPVVSINKDGCPGEAKEYPRIAGISSFGAGGANAHLVVEEYVDDSSELRVKSLELGDRPALIVLSAKNLDCLKEYAERLLQYTQRDETFNSSVNLTDLAYTLQVGRDAMEERLGFVVNSMKELEGKLQGFIEGRDDIEDIYFGQVKQNRDNLAGFAADEDMAKTIEAWISKKKYNKLADLWVKGLIFDWNNLYGDDKPYRISAPTYPFAKEIYRVETGLSPAHDSRPSGMKSYLHPLLQENISNLSEQRFSSTFTGDEFFLKDHQVNGEKVLPGVAYLEMASEAIKQASVEFNGTSQTIQLKNIGWIRPIVVVDKPIRVNIGLFPENNGEVSFEIYTDNPNIPEVPFVHCRGQASILSIEKKPSLNLDDLRAKINGHSFDPEECYETFKSNGINYGPAHRGMEKVYVGNDEVLVKLTIPSSVSGTINQFTLHPSLLDSAAQSSIGISLAEELMESLSHGNPSRPSLPFALESIEIIDSCAESMWGWIRYSVNRESLKVQKLDIDLCDESGMICARMRGFSSRVLEGEVTEKHGPNGVLTAKPVWEEKPFGMEQKFAEDVDHLVFLCGLNQKSLLLKDKTSQITFIVLESSEKTLEQSFTAYSLKLFENIQNIMQGKPGGYVFIQVLVPAYGAKQVFCGLSGLLKTAHLENPQISGQVIAVGEEETAETLIAKLQENRKYQKDELIRYEGANRLVCSFKELTNVESVKEFPWKDDGVYLITGGAGGLGLIFVKEIVEKVKKTTLILTGRSELSKEKQARLIELESPGVKIEYKLVDVCNKKAVDDLITNIRNNFGCLNGIIHSAGVICDNFILKKSKAEFEQALAPKVAGVMNLDNATKALDLDFFVLFSSGAGVTGNIGQADYSTANAFMDSFSRYRNSLLNSGERKGQTISINWPLWKEGGMGVDDGAAVIKNDNNGVTAMETSSGIKAFYQSLASGESQVMVMQGELKKLYAFLSKEADDRTEESMEEIKEEAFKTKDLTKETLKTETGNGELEEKTVAYFKSQFSKIVKLPTESIRAKEPFENYGIDSIIAMQLTSELEKTFGSLSKTLFFEYQNIHEISGYFLQSYRPQLVKLLKVSETNQIVQRKRESVQIAFSSNESAKRIQRNRFVSGLSKPSFSSEQCPLDIAVIGLSGRYPEARNLDEYWQNLSKGKDCITEVPIDRWDWKDYYSEDRNQAGRHYSKWGGFIADVDKFDPTFFKISRQEAVFMDPQERLFLEHAWMALEDAGYRCEDLHGDDDAGDESAGQVGVYAGVMYGHYQLFGAEESLRGNPMAVGGSYAGIANRVSYVLNLHGPSLTLDTMCSSSLTTLHLACQDLKLGLTDLGIAGGVNLSIHPNKYLSLSSARMISSKRHCESFGEGGDGYIPGEGVGVVLLKRFSDAKRDGDHIYGIIKGSAVNHGGRTNGYSIPDPNAQKAVILRSLKESQINPATISYIEAHGTGTKLGDAIEITGLTKVFGSSEERQHCRIGSAKSNIGHCESAAGIAGLTKVLLQMRYGQIAPSLHSEVLNPNIDFTKTPFVVNQELRDWTKPVIDGKEYPRIAGVSCFGAGGSNAHVLVEEYIDDSSELRVKSLELGDRPALIVLSAKNLDRLKEYAERLLQFTRRDETFNSAVNLTDLAYTLQVGRDAMEERLGLIVYSMEDLEGKLQSFIKIGAEEYIEGVDDIYFGQVQQNNDALVLFTEDEELQQAVGKWIECEKFSKLLSLWVKGLPVDWNKLYGESKPQRISAPTYPFARERYWIDQVAGVRSQESEMTNHLNPLFQENRFDLSPQRLKTETYSGWQFSIPGNGYDSGSLHSNFSIEEKSKMFALQLIADQLKKTVNLVDKEQTYFDMGLTSLGIANVTMEIKNKIDEDFQVTLLFEYTTVTALSSYLVQNYADVIDKLIMTKKEFEREVLETDSTLSKKNYEDKEDYMLPIFDELERGNLSLDEVITLMYRGEGI